MRFSEPVYPLTFFSEEIWVKCPNCADIGLVKTQLGENTISYPSGHTSNFTCYNCSTRKANEQEWFGYYQGILDRACGFCGTKILFGSQPTKSPYSTENIKCPTCKREKEYELKWYRYKHNLSIDPYFGLELWLQTSIKGNTLWLFNLDHLNYLRKYVQAKLREDDLRYKYSMITNLPQWIKDSKNRDLIVRKLNKLERDFSKLGVKKIIES